jgi:hypothetical protein
VKLTGGRQGWFHIPNFSSCSWLVCQNNFVLPKLFNPVNPIQLVKLWYELRGGKYLVHAVGVRVTLCCCVICFSKSSSETAHKTRYITRISLKPRAVL